MTVKVETIVAVIAGLIFGFCIGSVWQYNLDKTAAAEGNFPWKDSPGHPWHHGVPER